MVCRELDRVRVRGRAHAVTIYQPLGRTLAIELRAEAQRVRMRLWQSIAERKFVEAEIATAALAAAHPAQSSTRSIGAAARRFASSRRRRMGWRDDVCRQSEVAMTASTKRARSSGRKKRISLALQGGGSHGAFTWGVLEALLEDGRFEFAGLSGTSAGE